MKIQMCPTKKNWSATPILLFLFGGVLVEDGIKYD